MSNKNKNKPSLEDAIRSTMSDIDDILAKSGHPMGDAKEAPGSEDQGSDKMQKMDPKMQKMDPEMHKDGEEEYSQEPPMEGGDEYSQEPEMGGDEYPEEDGAGEMQEHLGQMSDEELDEMIQMLSQEKESRSMQEPEMGGDEYSQEPEMGGDEYSQEPPMEKGYKEDYLKLTKSLSGITGAIEKMNDSVSKLASDVNVLKRGRKKVSAKAVASSRVEVLEKSSPAPKKVERLSKSETTDFLVSEVRRGNKSVNSGIVNDSRYVETAEELQAFQNDLIKQGIKFPELG